MKPPLKFVFGLHVHQPVGNFDYVMADHVRDVYRPIIERATAAGFFPLTLHVSGPLLEWLEEHDVAWLDMIGRLASDRKLELLLAGFDEPILASLPKARSSRADRSHARVLDAALWRRRHWSLAHRARLATGARGGSRRSGRRIRARRRSPLPGERLPQRRAAPSAHHRINGRRVGLLAIDERLRYLIPFRPPEETAAYLRQLRTHGHELAVLADDGEKFGGWPGTKDWVYGSGWLDNFLHAMERLITAGEIALSTGQEAFRKVASRRPRLPPHDVVSRNGKVVAARRGAARRSPSSKRSSVQRAWRHRQRSCVEVTGTISW
mgnify:CR=1 FL=1